MSEDINPQEFRSLNWSPPTNVREALDETFCYAVKTAKEAIGWYFHKKETKSFCGQFLRFFAIVLTTTGGLVPLLIAGKITKIGGLNLNAEYGFIALALAGACIALDKFFGFSSAWIRYVTAAMNLQQALNEFYLDWSVLISNLDGNVPTAPQREVLLRKVQAFLQKVLGEVQKETSEWAAEYRSNLTELEKQARQQLDTVQKQIETGEPGTVILEITNVEQFAEGVAVSLDGEQSLIAKQTFTKLGTVKPGARVVTATAKADNKSYSALAKVTVPAGQPVAVQMTLNTKP